MALGFAQEDAKDDCLTCKATYEKPCSLYMAPSTIPGAGWGVFTAVDLQEGDSIGEIDYIIPVLDKFKTLPYRGQQQFLSWLGYVWPSEPDFFYRATQDSFPTIPQAMYKVDPGLNGATSLKFRDDDKNRVSAFAPGIASLVNSGGPDLVNIKSLKKKRQISFVARHDLKAGSELFLHYGDIWHERLEERQTSQVEYDTLEDYNTNILPNKTLPTEQDKRNKITQKKRKQLEMDDDDEFQDGSFNNALEGIKKYMNDVLGNRKSSTDMKEEYHHSSNVDKVEAVEQETPKQDLDWLKQHGMCIDTLRSGPSKKRGAARFPKKRGAFAKKHILKGERIAPAPLLALKRDDLNIYEADESKKVFGEVLDMTEVDDEEELLNYCFGHPDSELLFVPYTPIVNFINHGGKNPNAKIQWPKDLANEFLQLHPLDVLDMSGKLMAEFVALRDIEPDEEIVIDFGEDWDEEWWDHREEYDDMTEFRHEIGAPDGFFPDNWINQSVVYELAKKRLQPGELELMRWKHNGKPICKHCYRVGMPQNLTQHIRDLADERGITKLYEKLLYNDILDTNEWTTFEAHQEQWFAQQYEAKAWNFNMVRQLLYILNDCLFCTDVETVLMFYSITLLLGMRQHARVFFVLSALEDLI